MQIAKTSRLKLMLFVFVLLMFAFCFQGKTSAMSSRGPDLSDLGMAAGDKAGYVLVDTSAARVRQTSIPLYFSTNSGNSISVVGGDLCAANGNPNAYRDRNNPQYGVNSLVALYSVGSAQVGGYTSNSGNCAEDVRTINISPSDLVYDSTTQLYKGIFLAQMPVTATNIENVFHIVASANGIVGYSSANSAQGFGIEQESPQGVYRNYALPFAPDCSVIGPTTASINIYDPDNGTPDIQPTRFNVSVYDSTVGANVQLSPNDGTDAGIYTPDAANNHSNIITFTVQTNHKYIFKVRQVYSVNILQFQLPFDSIYYKTGCLAPIPTCTVTVTPVAILQGERFTATFKLTNYSQYTKLGALYPPGTTWWGKDKVNIDGATTTVELTGTHVDMGANNFKWGLIDGSGNWYGGNNAWPAVVCTTTMTVREGPFDASTTCGTLRIEPGSVELGNTARVNIDAKISGGHPGAQRYTATTSFSGPSPLPPTANGSILSGPPPGVTYDGRLSSAPISFGLTPTKVGKYNVAVTINFTGANNSTNGAIPVTCPGTLKVVTKPYLKINNGDVAAGVTATTCQGWGNTDTSAPNFGAIKTWNQAQAGGPPNNGAGTNLAAYAIGVIDGFATAQSTPNPQLASLTFANNDGHNPFGGNFKGGIDCPTDYWGYKTDAETLSNPNLGVPPSNGQTTWYYEGNAYIANNITLDPVANPTPYNLHRFKLVVKGNIYIASGVTNLDGIYVAQPKNDGTGGNIYTCANLAGNGSPKATDLNGNCKLHKLTINGAFIAKEVKLYRSKGTLKDAPSDDSVAEQFNYTPNVWLTPSTTDGRPTLGTKYDSITSLPPVL